MIGLNIEMPKSCKDCPCWLEEGYCIPLDIYVGENRSPDCPRVEDVAEVVRCKDCEFNDGRACEYSAIWVHPNGYCHWGRKKEEQ